MFFRRAPKSFPRSRGAHVHTSVKRCAAKQFFKDLPCEMQIFILTQSNVCFFIEHWYSSVFEAPPMRNASFERLTSMKKLIFWRTSHAKCYMLRFGSDSRLSGAFIFRRTSHAKRTFSKSTQFWSKRYMFQKVMFRMGGPSQNWHQIDINYVSSSSGVLFWGLYKVHIGL